MSPAVRYHCYLRDGRRFFKDIFIEVELIFYNRLFSEPLLNITRFDIEGDAN